MHLATTEVTHHVCPQRPLGRRLNQHAVFVVIHFFTHGAPQPSRLRIQLQQPPHAPQRRTAQPAPHSGAAAAAAATARRPCRGLSLAPELDQHLRAQADDA